MKIELINENQIRCTLTRSDLASHQIKLSELAYGTEKTRDLFQDMMDQAFTEFGFESSDSLMIEAIPVSMDCIVLMITKVDPQNGDGGEFAGLSSIAEIFPDNEDSALDDLIDCLSDDQFLQNGLPEKTSVPTRKTGSGNTPVNTSRNHPLECVYSFADIDTVINFAHNANYEFKGKSLLYRSSDNGRYYLKLTCGKCDIHGFAGICSLALEYGRKEPTGLASGAFMDEHLIVVISSGALQKLADV